MAVVKVNTSDYALKEYLSQMNPKMGMLYLVAFYSRKLIGAKEWYEIYDKEILAIVKYLKQ